MLKLLGPTRANFHDKGRLLLVRVEASQVADFRNCQLLKKLSPGSRFRISHDLGMLPEQHLSMIGEQQLLLVLQLD